MCLCLIFCFPPSLSPYCTCLLADPPSLSFLLSFLSPYPPLTSVSLCLPFSLSTQYFSPTLSSISPSLPPPQPPPPPRSSHPLLSEWSIWASRIRSPSQWRPSWPCFWLLTVVRSTFCGALNTEVGASVSSRLQLSPHF